jgi:hypothetical protein
LSIRRSSKNILVRRIRSRSNLANRRETRTAHRVPATRSSGVVRDTKYNSNQLVQSARVTITTCDVSVRCTGHLFAISSNLDRCSFVNDPLKWRSSSIRSSMPSLVSHSAQSDAWTFECRRLTAIFPSGHRFRRAYIPTVIEVQAPNAASRKS